MKLHISTGAHLDPLDFQVCVSVTIKYWRLLITCWVPETPTILLHSSSFIDTFPVIRYVGISTPGGLALDWYPWQQSSCIY